MQDTYLDCIPVETIPCSASPRQIRLWCAPEVILMVTNSADEQTLLLEAVKQARGSAAKILLAYVTRPYYPESRSRRSAHPMRRSPSAHRAQLLLERMARQLRWAGIASEPVLLQGLPAEEIPQLVRLRGVNRVIVTTKIDPCARGIATRAIAEQILPRVGVPVCLLGGSLPAASQFTPPLGRVTLALSPEMNCAVLLSFACRFAEQHHATLTVLHVFPPGERIVNGTDGSAVCKPLPHFLWPLREPQSQFPFQTRFCEGELAQEILAQTARSEPDFIILGTPGITPGYSFDGMRVMNRLVNEAPCPVLILGSAIAHSISGDPRLHADPESERRHGPDTVQAHSEVDEDLAGSSLEMLNRVPKNAACVRCIGG